MSWTETLKTTLERLASGGTVGVDARERREVGEAIRQALIGLGATNGHHTKAARSWTGRVCAEDHCCRSPLVVHCSADGVRWRGNADDVPDGGASEVHPGVRAAFLAYVEAGARGNGLSDKRNAYFGTLIDILARACGVVWVEDETRQSYLAGPWPSNESNWWGVDAEAMNEGDHHRRWHGYSWGCAL